MITAKNGKYSKPFLAHLITIFSFKDIYAQTDYTVTKPGQERLFTINYDSLGEPSCALISLTTTNSKSASITIGTDIETCDKLYPGITFKEAYKQFNSSWNFSLIFNTIGLIQVNIDFKNEYSSANLRTSASVSDLDCNRPELEIQDRNSLFYDPKLIKKSKIFSIIGITNINCQKSLKNLKNWFVYLVNISDGSVIKQVDISKNPTVNNAELVIPPNSLEYGTFKFVYKVAMTDGVNNLEAFQTEIDHYIKIVESGIIVQAFENGISIIKRGTGQTIVLDPVLYSYDLDATYPMKSLKFKFYCSVVENGIVIKKPYTALNNKIDLLSMKTNPSLFNSNISCFEYTSSYHFDNTSNKLTINAGGLAFYLNREYKFSVETTYLGKVYSQKIGIKIDDCNFVPVISIG